MWVFEVTMRGVVDQSFCTVTLSPLTLHSAHLNIKYLLKNKLTSYSKCDFYVFVDKYSASEYKIKNIT